MSNNSDPDAMSNKFVLSQSIMWAAVVLVVAISQEKQFAVLMLIVLATTALLYLKKQVQPDNQGS
ncbi:MAG: hypothetical protein ACO3J5_09730 [Pseudohongiellaceae bacterium]